MIIQCPKCATRFALTEEAIANIADPSFHCSRCSHYFSLAENAYQAEVKENLVEETHSWEEPHDSSFNQEEEIEYPDEFEEFAVQSIPKIDDQDDISEQEQPSEKMSFKEVDESQQLELIGDDSTSFDDEVKEILNEEPFSFDELDDDEDDDLPAVKAQWPGEESDKDEVWTQPPSQPDLWKTPPKWAQPTENVSTPQQVEDKNDIEDDVEEDVYVDPDIEIENEEELLKTIPADVLEEELYNFFPEQSPTENISEPSSVEAQTTSAAKQTSERSSAQVVDFPSAAPEVKATFKNTTTAFIPKKRFSLPNISGAAILCSMPLLLLLALTAISSQKVENSKLLSLLQSIYQTELPSPPPPGIELIDLSSKLEPLNADTEIVEVTGSIYNATLETYRNVAIKAQTFDHKNTLISQIIAPADNSLLNASLKSLDLSSLEELQDKPSINGGIIRPNEKLPFKIILPVEKGEEAWFTARIHSVTTAPAERLLRN